MGSATQLGSSDFTVEAWFKTSASAAEETIFFDGGDGTSTCGNGAKVLLRVNAANQLRFYVQDGSSVTGAINSAATVNNGAWHHAVGTRSGSTLTLYLDGASAGTTTAALGSVNQTGQTMSIGASNPCSLTPGGLTYFNGSIDDVSLYTTALSSTRVLAHYTAGTTSGSSPTYNLTATASDDVGVSR